MNHKENINILVFLAIFGSPPNSAPTIFRLKTKVESVVIAHTLKTVTLKPREPAGTANAPVG